MRSQQNTEVACIFYDVFTALDLHNKVRISEHLSQTATCDHIGMGGGWGGSRRRRARTAAWCSQPENAHWRERVSKVSLSTIDNGTQKSSLENTWMARGDRECKCRYVGWSGKMLLSKAAGPSKASLSLSCACTQGKNISPSPPRR